MLVPIERPSMDYPHRATDRQATYYELFDQRIRAHLRSLVNHAVIEEHRRRPLGQHSESLDRLLNYFRRGGMAGKLGLLWRADLAPGYRIVVFPGQRGGTVTVEEAPAYPTLGSAYHAVFLRRIAGLLETQ